MYSVAVVYRRRACFAIAIFFAASLAWASAAAASCDPGRTPLAGHAYFDGWWAGPSTGAPNCLTGSEADILNKNPFVYSDSSDDQTFGYAMLFNSASSGYAQVGWMKDQNGARNNFSEVDTAETNWDFSRKLYGSSDVGSSPTYEMTYSSGWFHFLINGDDYRDFSSSTYHGCDAEQSGEIHNRDSQMPGEVNGHDTFTTARVRDTNGWFYTGKWSVLSGDSNGNPPNTFLSSTSGSPLNEIEIWDSACIG